MRIIESTPPNFKEITSHFPEVAKRNNIVFTYGDAIYNPSGIELPDHLIEHEKKHMEQQKDMGVDAWWAKYFEDVDFRYKQELEAYARQYQFVCEHVRNNSMRKKFLFEFARFLSSGVYGNIVSHGQAESQIKNLSKK